MGGFFSGRPVYTVYDENNFSTCIFSIFFGVFIPTCENMWGVLIFLRFNYVVGNAGIGFALLTKKQKEFFIHLYTVYIATKISLVLEQENIRVLYIFIGARVYMLTKN